MEESGKEHMSEEERDFICEKLGDEPGVRAKRRREIEVMSAEEMQAEIGRTEAAMRERVKSASQRSLGLSTGKLHHTGS